MDIRNLLSSGLIALNGRAPALGTGWANLNGFPAAAVDIDWNIQFPAGTPSKLDIASSSAGDASAGANAQQVLIVGLGADPLGQKPGYYNPIWEILSLNGNTVVTTVKYYQRVFAMQVYKCNAAAAHGANAGDIYAVKTGTGAFAAGVPATTTGLAVVIPAGLGTGFSGIWTIPYGEASVGYRLFNYTAGVRANAGTFGVFSQDPNDGQGGAWNNEFTMELSTGSPVNSELDPDIASDWTRHQGSIYEWSKPGTDIILRGQASAAATFMSVQVLLRRMG